MSGHQLIEERSLWLHRAVADKARQEPEVLSRARERVDVWLLDGSVHPRYAEAWRRLLALRKRLAVTQLSEELRPIAEGRITRLFDDA